MYGLMPLLKTWITISSSCKAVQNSGRASIRRVEDGTFDSVQKGARRFIDRNEQGSWLEIFL